MAEPTNLESLQALYADLLALSEQRLLSIERLGLNLTAHIQDFKNLLDKNSRNNQSRKNLESGKITIQENDYAINDEFQRGAQQLADELDLDEMDAARIFFEAQEETIAPGQPILTNSIVRFHQRRKYLLDNLRLLLQMSSDIDLEEVLREDLQSIIGQIVTTQASSKKFTQRCFSSMSDIEKWLQKLADKLNGASIVGKLNPEILEATEYQRVSLIKQHESLSTILLYLVRENYSRVEDLHHLLEILKKSDKYDNLLVHYLPVLSACIAKYGGTDAAGGMTDARALHQRYITAQSNDQNSWTLTYLHAAFRVLWLSEYNGWYSEAPDGSILDTQLEDEAKQVPKLFTEALKDGAFDFILSVSADVKSADWQDPARHGLRQWLQRKSPVLLSDSVAFSDFFQNVLMEQLEIFIESSITNLPDVLRKLRIDEDEQRQLSKDHDHDLDLERFIVIISYTFEGRPKAALEAFWDDPHGALIGFVHWASQRASTPLVSAFCEMLQSISEDEKCAKFAHQFLLDEGIQVSGKMKRPHSLTWTQIINELTYFSKRIKDYLAHPQSQHYRSFTHGSLLEAEPESVMMLECYLRLVTRLFSNSEDAKEFIIKPAPALNFIELLFQLAGSAIGPRLRANAFLTLRALLSNKLSYVSDVVWSGLEIWLSGGFASSTVMTKSTSALSVMSKGPIIQGLLSGFEEPNALIQLLQTLVLPYPNDTGLNDALTFPETLGGSARQPGIDPFIDLVVGDIFGRQPKEVEYLEVTQRRILNLSCLNFITTCLETFNENLIILGSQLGVSVDFAIKASSLQAYILLHPFSRTMEWLFNEKIMNAIFAVVQQDPAEVARAEPDSPLILSLLQGIRLIILILDLEPTYLDIVQPLLRSYPSHRPLPASNGSFASFEDGMLNHLGIFPILGRYCGTGHPELVILSLKLLEKIFSSPKFSSPNFRRRSSGRDKALAALDEDSETISKILLREMESEIDANQGPESPAYIIKLHVLEFLIACLQSAPNQPSIAHLLLGFRWGKEGLFIDPQSSFNRGISLFHTILSSVLSAPTGDETGFTSWMVSLHFKALQVLKELWVAPIAASIIIPTVRANEFFFIMYVKEQVIQSGMTWDGLQITDPDFLSSTGALCLSEFLGRRAILLQYLSTELLRVSQSHSPSLKQRIMETLMGSTRVDDGQIVDHANIFDLFDFMDPELTTLPSLPQLTWLSDLELAACSDEENGSLIYDLEKLEELLSLRRVEIQKANQLESTQDLTTLEAQSQELINYCTTNNQIKLLTISRRRVLKSWVQLILIMIEVGTFDDATKTSFVLRVLQVIIPRLEGEFQVLDEAVELAWLAKALIFCLDFKAECFSQGDIAELVSDRLFHLFQISLRAINTLGTKIYLKEWHYKICFRYLAGTSDLSGASRLHRRHSIQTIKSAGDKLLDVVCDDAINGESTCRISALLVLICLVKLGKEENSKYIVESLIRLNFIGLLIESLHKIPQDLQETPIEELDMQLSNLHAKLALLQQIAETRFGATAVYNAGLFHAIEDSGLFIIDPDLGVDIEGPGAVGKHYNLVVAVLRILCTTMISRGPQNHQTLQQARRFLSNNRLSILSVLKKSAGLGALDGISPDTIEDLTELYLLLLSFTEFLEHDGSNTFKKTITGTLSSFT
ncbi:Nucleoporin [Podosphaera aphanis]|nr:Nucleoporin [Podosphaera aphanis]